VEKHSQGEVERMLIIVWKGLCPAGQQPGNAKPSEDGDYSAVPLSKDSIPPGGLGDEKQHREGCLEKLGKEGGQQDDPLLNGYPAEATPSGKSRI